MIYKICSEKEWADAVAQGTFKGAAIDLRDGYIHFSNAEQLRETAAKHFGNQDHLVLLKVATAPMARHYKMEVSRGGALFPHLYAKLPLSSVAEWQELNLGEDGFHVFPDDVPQVPDRP